MRIVKDIRDANAVTHGGLFHADDVAAAVMLSKIMDLRLSRVSRVPDDVPEDVVVFDIGGGSFDHHQRGGNGARENGVPYASAGLVWRHYGMRILTAMGVAEDDLEAVWAILDETIVQGIDAVDCGAVPRHDDSVRIMTLSEVVSVCNVGVNPDDEFVEAFEIMEKVFDRSVARAADKVAKAKLVEEAIEASDGIVLVLEEFMPWQGQIFASKSSKAEGLLYVVFPSMRGGYSVQAVPVEPGSFENRKPFPESWRGLKEDELRVITGVETITFCHPNGFFAATDRFEDAIKLAKLAAKI